MPAALQPPPSPLRPASAPLPQTSPMRPASTSAQSSPLRPAGQAPAQFQAFTAFKAGGPLRQAAPQPPPPPAASSRRCRRSSAARGGPPAPGPPLQSAPPPPPPAPTPQAETGERYAFCKLAGRRHRPALRGRLSLVGVGPSLKAKHGNAKADYSHLPPPPTFGAPPPPPPPASY